MVSRVHRYPNIAQEAAPDGPLPKLLLLGTCGVTPLLIGLREQGVPAEQLLWESLRHAPAPEIDEETFDALIVSVTLTHIFFDASALLEPERPYGNTIYFPRAVAIGRVQDYFDACAGLVRERVAAILPLCAKRPVFFLSFLEPKHNYLGNLLPRYDLSNPAWFVQKLNMVLAEAVAGAANAHFLDTNELLNLVGRARIQDDYTTYFAHGGIIGDDHSDPRRIQRSTPPPVMWGTLEALPEFTRVLARRILDDLAILRAPMQIKAIIADIDDTLWRGVALEELDKPHHEFIEGWPLGMAEALLFFKARGGMLALCSKNDETALRQRWVGLYHGRLRLTDFAARRINYERKSDNVRAILAELNVLPANVLFIDDNPREIDEVRAAFPDMRFLSAEHHDWRRKILMSAATQVPAISGDAALRTASVQANALREQARAGLSYEEWLHSLGLEQTITLVRGPDHPRFERAFELINKTNQFNTTGRRWTRAEVAALLADGGVLVCSMLRDRMADNGMISVVIVQGDAIVQAVLSCRAFKFGAEIAAGHVACRLVLARHPQVRGRIVDTGLNKTCHGWFGRLGFHEMDGEWVGTQAPPVPSHLYVIEDGDVPAAEAA